MKKLYALLFILCLLLGGACISASAAAEATDPLASNYISDDVSSKLEETVDCDAIIKIYHMQWYFRDILPDKSIQQLIEENTTQVTYAVFNEETHITKSAKHFAYENGTIRERKNNNYKSDSYVWLSDVVETAYLQVDGKVKEVQNIYCIKGEIYMQCPMVVYDVGDAKYYAVYETGMEGAPIYLDEPSFYTYISAWIKEWDELHALPEGDEDLSQIPWGGGAPDVSADQFNPLDVTLRKTAVPIWVLPAGIALGVVALGGTTAFVIVRTRKKKAAQEE